MSEPNIDNHIFPISSYSHCFHNGKTNSFQGSPFSSLTQSLILWSALFASVLKRPSIISGLLSRSAASTSSCLASPRKIILSYTASQFPAQPLTVPAIFFNISDSPLISSGVGSSSSVSTLYLNKSTTPPSSSGSFCQCFLTSERPGGRRRIC